MRSSSVRAPAAMTMLGAVGSGTCSRAMCACPVDVRPRAAAVARSVTASPTRPWRKKSTRRLVTPSMSKPIGRPTSAPPSSATSTSEAASGWPAWAVMPMPAAARVPVKPTSGRKPSSSPTASAPRTTGYRPAGRSTRPRPARAWAMARETEPATSSRPAERLRSTQCAVPSSMVAVSAPDASVAAICLRMPALVATSCWVTARPNMPAASPPAARAAAMASLARALRAATSYASVSLYQ